MVMMKMMMMMMITKVMMMMMKVMMMKVKMMMTAMTMMMRKMMIIGVVVVVMMMMMTITVLVPINKNNGHFEDIRETGLKLCRVAPWECFGNGLLTLFSAQPCNSGSIQVSGKLPTYPSPKLTLTLASHLGQNVGLGRGWWAVSWKPKPIVSQLKHSSNVGY